MSHSQNRTPSGPDHNDFYDEHLRKALRAVYDKGFEAGVQATKSKIADMRVQLTPMDRNVPGSKL